MSGPVSLLCEGVRAVGTPGGVGAAGHTRSLGRVLASELREPAIICAAVAGLVLWPDAGLGSVLAPGPVLAARNGLGRSHSEGSGLVDLRAAVLGAILGSRLGGVVAHDPYCPEETRKTRTGAFGPVASGRVDTTQNDEGAVGETPCSARTLADSDRVIEGSEGSTDR